MKFGIAQMTVIAGAMDKNFETMERMIRQAKVARCDCIVFPLNALSGLYLGDAWLSDDFCRRLDKLNEKIIAMSEDIAIVWGNIRYRHHKRFNCAFFAYEGETRMKVRTPRHQLMDESRYFEDKEMDSPICFKGMDIHLGFDDEINHTGDLMIRLGQRPFVKEGIEDTIGENLLVNPVGISSIGKNVLIFDGASCYQKDEMTLFRAPAYQEGLYFYELGQKAEVAPLPSLCETLLYGIKEFDARVFNGRVNWVIGLSGGLDSSVNAALLTLALGKERVFAYNMASAYNSEMTKNNAHMQAENLGIECRDGSIERLTQATVDTLIEYGYEPSEWHSLVKENIQARIRGHLLSSFASIVNGVIVNNGNKVEVALGYCTLYGDAVGAVGPLGDCTKVDLFAIARELNLKGGKQIVPETLLPEVKADRIDWEMPPSAELKDGQFDPMKWFYHDELLERFMQERNLDDFVASYIDGRIKGDAIYRWILYYHLDDPIAFAQDLKWFLNTMQRNAFKRLQLPPIFLISKAGFGNGFVETQGVVIAERTMKLLDQLERGEIHAA